MKPATARRKSRLARFATAWLDTTGTGLIGLVIAAIGLFQTTHGNSQAVAQPVGPPRTSYVLIGLGLLLMLIHMGKAYRTRTYDMEVMWHLLDDWNSEDLLNSRPASARICLKFLEPNESSGNWTKIKESNPLEVSCLNEVLDVLEDLGFFVEHGRVSDEIAHHYFAHYVFMYWLSGGKEYISLERSAQRAVWTDIENLFNRLLLFESERTGGSEEDIKNDFKRRRHEFLCEERDLKETLSPTQS
jgi:hypothetical protein